MYNMLKWRQNIFVDKISWHAMTKMLFVTPQSEKKKRKKLYDDMAYYSTSY